MTNHPDNMPMPEDIARYEQIRRMARALIEVAVVLEMTPIALCEEIRSHLDDSIEDF